MKQLPILYKRTNTGAIQQWTITVSGDTYFTEHGQVGGVIQQTAPTVCVSKNTGKSNATTGEQQALIEAQAKWRKQIDDRYTQDITKVDEALLLTYEPMAGHPIEKHTKKLQFPVIVQPKLDGARCVLADTTNYTRGGKKWYTVSHIRAALEPVFAKFPELLLDGELYNHDLHDEFEELMSLIKKQNLTVEDVLNVAEKVQYHIYDCPRIGSLTESSNYVSRMNALTTAFLEAFDGKLPSCIVLVPSFTASSLDEINKHHDTFVELGYEGAMVRRNGPYRQKRTSDLLKVKKFTDSEFPVVDFLEGRGGSAGMAAKVVCALPDGTTFEAGIIGSKPYCRRLLADTTDLVGKLATIKYFGFTADGKPRFGKMKGIRDYE